MLMASFAVLAGLILMVWSAERFVEGAAVTARYFSMPPLLIGMVVVGFGTSAPEMAVSALAASQGSPDIALGNAIGSNITNIALILGVSALICPILVKRNILKKELPVLAGISLFTCWLLYDGYLGRLDGIALLVLFAGLMVWSIVQARRAPAAEQGSDDFAMPDNMSSRAALLWLLAGLVLLVASSQALVWGATSIARELGVSELLIGLTIVAIGTSLPELASSVIAARKGEHEIALGNVLGSNLFNTLTVIGIAAIIQPMPVTPAILTRDLPVMLGLTLALFVLGYGIRKDGVIDRFKGLLLLTCYLGYSLYLILDATGKLG